jgi:hypothetical protein
MLQLKANLRMRTRIIAATVVGLISGTYCWLWLQRAHHGAGDFMWAIWAAQDLLAGRNPYNRPMQLYPLTCAIFGLPFVWMRPAVAGGIFYGISSALLGFGVSRHGYHRLLIFFAYPFWAGLLEAQWGPLIMASAFIAPLLPATLAKPQLGVPMLLTVPTRRGLIACVALTLASFLLFPGWLAQWISHLHLYARFVPVLVFPGPLLVLALLRYRHYGGRLLIMAALMPQRWFYDAFILWLIPKSRREIVWTVFFSWGAGVWRWYHIPHSFTEVGRWTVVSIYLPMLVVVMLRERDVISESEADAPL